ncbi:MAG: CU044_2847 family protein [Actinomadura sp.]
MNGLLRWEMEKGSVVVEVDDKEPGFRSAALDGAVRQASVRFEDALTDIRRAAERTLRTFRDKTLNPDGVEIEFGVKFNAAAGAVIARAAADAHLKVKLTWSQGDVPDQPSDDAAAQ